MHTRVGRICSHFANCHRCQIPNIDLWIQHYHNKTLMCFIVDLDEKITLPDINTCYKAIVYECVISAGIDK